MSDSAAPWTAACEASLSFTTSQNLPRLVSIELVVPSSYLILCCSLLLLPLIIPRIRVFPSKVALTSGGQSIGASALVSVFPMDIQGWFPLGLAGLILQSRGLLQRHNSKASVLWHSAFFMVLLPHLYMTVGETIVWTKQTFVGKVMSLLFNTLSRFVIAFLPRSKCLLISWL